MAVLEADGLAKAFGPTRVLAGADLRLDAGSVLALLGVSGSGKTTLLRLVAGFDRPDAGRITVGGLTVAGPGTFVPPERRRIGYVPQEGALFPHLSVAGNIGFGLPRRERSGPRLAAMLALTGLEGLERRYPHQLSGGQAQRTALARALAPRPALVLLDEPFNALDLAMRRSVAAEVTGLLRAAGASAILVTHDPAEAFVGADRVAVVAGGRVAQAGTPREVYADPASLEVARLTGPVVVVEGRMSAGRAMTALGPLAVRAPVPPEGRAVAVAVRPEQVRADASGPDGVVGAVTFLGDRLEATVTFASLTLPLRLPPDAAVATGDRVRLGIEGVCPAFLSDG